MEKWIFYMDESGQFERQSKDSLIVAMLVPEGNRAKLEEFWHKQVKLAVWQGRGCINKQEEFNRLHAVEFYKDKSRHKWAERLVEETIKNKVRVYVLEHKADMWQELGELSEVHAANRYLLMVQVLLEYILFLSPKFMDRDVCLEFCPNTRVFRPENERERQEFENLGFPSSHRKDGLYYVFNKTALRTMLHRLAVEYLPFQEVTGKRQFARINAVVAKDYFKQDPLVMWVDHLAYIVRYQKRFNQTVQDEISKRFGRLDYAGNFLSYKQIVRYYLARRFFEFVLGALNQFDQPEGALQEQVQYFLNRAIQEIAKTKENIDELERLERAIDRFIETSRGNWSLVASALFYLKEATQNLLSQAEDARTRRLYIRLLNHCLRLCNHRGDYKGANALYHQITLSLKKAELSFEDWRQWISSVNRYAVSLANIFAFKRANEMLEPYISRLEAVKRTSGVQLKDELLAKLLGTMGQNYAFMAPFDETCFERAEKCFLKAKEEFLRPEDKHRQDLYLFHLYFDGARQKAEFWNKVGQVLDGIKERGFGEFLQRPSKGTAKFKQFELHAYLKYLWSRGTQADWQAVIERFTRSNLRAWFDKAEAEHPFELIYMYLGCLAYRLGQRDTASTYFERACQVPAVKDKNRFITLLPIWAQVRVRYALLLLPELPEAAQQQIKMARSLLDQMKQQGQIVWFDDVLEDCLTRTEVSVWQAFLQKFTFNYY